MTKFRLFSIVCIFTWAVAASSATPDSPSITARIQKTLQARLPQAKIEKVQPSPWPGLYEVITDSELVYSDASGDFLFVGNVMDTKSRENLTEKKWNQMLQVDFNSLPLNLAIKTVKGDGSRKLVVFSDPHCPFCVRLEKTLQEVNNVTVYTLLFPIESLHPGSTERAKQLWCSKDRVTAWSEWMLNKKDTPAADCKSETVDTLVALGNKMKVNGTPTLIFADGHRVAGTMNKEQLEKEFAAVSAPRSGG